MGQPRPHSSSNGAGSGAEHGPCSPPRPPSPHSPTTSSRTSFQRMWLPVSCRRVTVIRLWMPCQAPGERTRSDGWTAGRGGGGAGVGCGAQDGVGCGVGGASRSPHLVEQEGPHARHPATVVHHCRDVAGREAAGLRACPAEPLERSTDSRPPGRSRGQGNTTRCPRAPPPRMSRGPLPSPAWATPAPDSLAVGLQLADLEVDQQVVLAVAGARAGSRQRAELGGWHWGDREKMRVQTDRSQLRARRGGGEQSPSSGENITLHGDDWQAPPRGADGPRPPPREASMTAAHPCQEGEASSPTYLGTGGGWSHTYSEAP